MTAVSIGVRKAQVSGWTKSYADVLRAREDKLIMNAIRIDVE
jgi:hypothetical protein